MRRVISSHYYSDLQSIHHLLTTGSGEASVKVFVTDVAQVESGELGQLSSDLQAFHPGFSQSFQMVQFKQHHIHL